MTNEIKREPKSCSPISSTRAAEVISKRCNYMAVKTELLDCDWDAPLTRPARGTPGIMEPYPWAGFGRLTILWTSQKWKDGGLFSCFFLIRP